MKLGFPLSRLRRRRSHPARQRLRPRRLIFQSLEPRQLLSDVPLFANGVNYAISPVSSTETTGEKPQSKVWQHDGHWWAVIPTDLGTWLWQLDQQTWNPHLQLSSRTNVQADVKPLGDEAHILLFGGTTSELISIEYVYGDTPAYQLWEESPTPVTVTLSSGVETATLDIDSTSRMWIASDASSTVEVRYSDYPYTSFSPPITIGTGISSDDIAAVKSLPTGEVGVLWSNQNVERFVYRYHLDGAAPDQWSTAARPAPR